MKKRSEATQTLRAGCSKKQTNKQTGAITIHCAAASLARSVVILILVDSDKLIMITIQTNTKRIGAQYYFCTQQSY